MKKKLNPLFLNTIKTLNNNYYLIDPINRTFFPLPILFNYLMNQKGINTFDNSFGILTNNLREKGYLISKQRIKLLKRQLEFFKFNFLGKDIKNKVEYTRLLNDLLIEDNLKNTKQVIFEVTDKCNLDCTYCCYGPIYTNYDKREGNIIDFSIIKTTIDYYIKVWKERACIPNEHINISFYGGEPLLAIKTIKKTVKYLEEIDLPTDFFIFSLTTNGLLLKKCAAFLVEKKFQILVSLDGDAECNEYRKNHVGVNSFPTIRKNLEFIETNFPEYFKNCIRFSSILHNKNSLKKIDDFFRSENLTAPSIGELSTSNVKNHISFSELYRSFNCEVDSISKLKDFYSSSLASADSLSFFRKYCTKYYENFYALLNSNQTKIIVPTSTCLPLSLRIYISINGKIFSCEKIGHKYSVGFVNSETGISLELSKAIEDFNKLVSTYKLQCEKCYIRFDCKICAFKEGDLSSGQQCKEFKSDKEFIALISLFLSIIEEYTGLYHKAISVSIG